MKRLVNMVMWLVYLALLVWFYDHLVASEGFDFPEWYHFVLFLAVVAGTLMLAIRLAKRSLAWSALTSLAATGLFVHFMLYTDVFSTGGGALFILPLMFLVGMDLFLLVVRALVRLLSAD